MATHSSVLAWEILWAEGPGGLQSVVWQSEHDSALTFRALERHYAVVWWVWSHLDLGWSVIHLSTLPSNTAAHTHFLVLPHPLPPSMDATCQLCTGVVVGNEPEMQSLLYESCVQVLLV